MQEVFLKDLWKAHFWPNLAGQISPCLIGDPLGRRFWLFSDQIFCNDFKNQFFNIKSLLRDHTGADVSLTKFQSRSNVK